MHQIHFLEFVFCFSDVTGLSANPVLEEVCEDCLSPPHTGVLRSCLLH